MEQNKPFDSLHNTQGNDFDYEYVKYFKDEG
jgi:hypothetical protein